MNKGRIKSGLFQFFIVILFAAAAVFTVKILIATKPIIKKRKPVTVLPIVRTMTIKLKPFAATVSDYGTVEPFRKFDLLPQVGGKTTYVSKDLMAGGSFKKGELLVKIDDADYKIAYTTALSKIENAKSNLAVLIAESAAAKSEWDRYNAGSVPPPLLIKIPQIEAAKAALLASEADLQMSKLNIERTQIWAICKGRVYSEQVAAGQYLNKGQKFATIYCTNKLKVVVHIDPAEAAFLQIPGYSTDKTYGSDALIKEKLGKKVYLWYGKIIGAAPIDEKTRTLPVIISIKNNYRPNYYLPIGSFVKVVLKGKIIKNAVVLPQNALHEDKKGEEGVFVVGADKRIIYKRVKIEKYSEKGAVSDGGLENGDLLVVSNGGFLKIGMKVNIDKRYKK